MNCASFRNLKIESDIVSHAKQCDILQTNDTNNTTFGYESQRISGQYMYVD